MITKRILLIEDEEVLSRAISAELEREGFKIIRAFNGEEGVKKAMSSKPNLILLDLILPKKNGFEVLGELKQSTLTKNIPVIILSALDQDEEIKKGLKMGADDYFVKSQHALAEIVEKINSFFKSGTAAAGTSQGGRVVDLRDRKSH
ncbi:MAG: response regulator [Candidatus Paceibacterota bacterium]|jgi:DNA-binding response OmpR family regulator|nr:response regulator [Candidatus Paceibacterota bacterium]